MLSEMPLKVSAQPIDLSQLHSGQMINTPIARSHNLGPNLDLDGLGEALGIAVA